MNLSTSGTANSHRVRSNVPRAYYVSQARANVRVTMYLTLRRVRTRTYRLKGSQTRSPFVWGSRNAIEVYYSPDREISPARYRYLIGQKDDPDKAKLPHRDNYNGHFGLFVVPQALVRYWTDTSRTRPGITIWRSPHDPDLGQSTNCREDLRERRPPYSQAQLQQIPNEVRLVRENAHHEGYVPSFAIADDRSKEPQPL